MSNIVQPWDTPVYFQPVRIRPAHHHHALSISLALAVIVTGITGTFIYNRMTQFPDVDTYVAMGPSQSRIEADHASSEPTLLVTLTPPVYPLVLNTVYGDASAVRLSARVSTADAAIISEATSGEMPAAQDASVDSGAPVEAVPGEDDGGLDDTAPAESATDSSM